MYFLKYRDFIENIYIRLIPNKDKLILEYKVIKRKKRLFEN
jgi:hypothetical protein